MPGVSNRPNSFSAVFMDAASQKGRRTLTNERSKTTFNALERFAKDQRWRDQNGKPITPQNITQKQLTKFIAHRTASVTPRSVQNEMSHIRRALHAVGRNDFADKVCTNKVLGVPSGSRSGTGKVVNQSVYASALARADPDSRAMMPAMREFGFRLKEVIQCGKSLPQWEREIRDGHACITVSRGTKGDKTRYVFIPPERREEALKIVQGLRERYVANGGKIVPETGLKEACKETSRRFAAAGLKGENSSHSLRRAFCEERVAYYQKQGYTLREAWGKTCIDVGHADARGRWLHNNYLKATAAAAAEGA